jgi:hypothetical protein
MTEAHHMSKPTEAGMTRFTALLEELSSERDVVKASMFGMPGIKRRGGKAFCGLYGDDMIFKLDGEDHARALKLDGARLFEPMAGRQMKAWCRFRHNMKLGTPIWPGRPKQAWMAERHAPPYSHSMVAGGLLVISRTTRLI